METKINKYTNLVLDRLDRRKGFARLHVLYEELSLLDRGIFNESGIMESEFRTKIIGMLDDDDMAMGTLSTLFVGYKENWLDSKGQYFESLDKIDYKNFIKEFVDLLPQDIIDAIKKSKSIDLTDLKLEDSVKIFEYYYKIREWLKDRITQELEGRELSDRELFLISQYERIKYKWLGKAVDLVGLFEELDVKKWIVPAGSMREKSALLLKCFEFSGKQRGLNSITNIYKKSTMNDKPFKRIENRR
jgi:hypothetical protein